MIDVEELTQLIDSMESAIDKLEKKIESGDKDDATKLKALIIDLHTKINEELSRKYV